MTTISAQLPESINQLLKHAYRNSNSGKACLDALLAACEPGRYPLEYGDLFCLDRENTDAALNILTYRLKTMDSIESIIGREEVQSLREKWVETNQPS
jgi:hypothetical protein|tara:strand:+ start:4752 stop:5045 length:294 start_codon:yes stop_codon:yes gene_type:complete